MNNDLLQNIVNRKNDQQIYTAIVESLTPLEVKMYTGDSAIKVKALTSCLGITIGSNVLMLKIMNQFVIIGVIGYHSAVRVITLSSAQTFSNTTMTNTSLAFDFEANSIYHFELALSALGDSAAGIQVDWLASGTIPNLQTRKCIGMAFGETDRDSAKVRMNQSYLTTAVPYGIESSTNYISEQGILETTTSGTLTMRAAKEVSTGIDTTISANSFLKVTKIR